MSIPQFRVPIAVTRSPSDPEYAIEVVDGVLSAAIGCGAGDIHLQPTDDHVLVRFRIDGVLHEIAKLDRGVDVDPATRLMAMAGLPTYAIGRPMEGSLRWRGKSSSGDHAEAADMRLGIFPTVAGLRAVVRLVPTQAPVQSIEDLGVGDELVERLSRLVDRRDGLVLVIGPAGSGKTTTTYACLRRIAATRPPRSVLAIEDPVECRIDAISQSRIDESSGMTLAAAVRGAVRQDAEVLSVGEVRDGETATAILSASMTGHLTFSSMHAATIGTALRRLQHMGISPHVLHSGLAAIVNQRLLRRLCGGCRNDAIERRGCDACGSAGYRGRGAVMQVIEFDSPIGGEIFSAFAEGCSASAIDSLARSHHRDVRTAADEVASEGLVDAPEIARVFGDLSACELSRGGKR